MVKQLRFFAGILFLLFSAQISHADTVDFADPEQIYDAGLRLSYFEDPTSSMSVNDVAAKGKFIHSDSKAPNFGVSASAFWVKIEVKNISGADHHLWLELAYPLLDTLEFFTSDSNGKFIGQKYGVHLPYRERKFDHPNFIFPIDLKNEERGVYYIRVKSQLQMVMPMNLGTQEKITKGLLQRDLFFGIYAGIILVMFFYNLFIYFTTRDRNYIYYVIYIFSVGLVQICLQGYTYKLLWPDSPGFAMKSVFYLSAIIGITAILFPRNFLHTKKNTPKLDLGLRIFVGIYTFYIILFVLGFTEGTYMLIQGTASLISFYMLYVTIVRVRQGDRSANFFLVAWSVFLAGVFIFALKDFGVLPYNDFTNYTMQMGSVIEALLFSFALADRINILKKENEVSTNKALEVSMENERIIREQNIMLDHKVQERTNELQRSNQELEVTLKNLRDAQAQLVNSEKMASLGQLTAGVAHEINNPINFVTGSIKPLKRDFADILDILGKYEGLTPDNFEEKRKEINAAARDLDLDYVKQEIESLLKGIEEGALRTSEIVKGLRTFSHVDESDIKSIDLNEGLESTLILLNSVLKGSITVEKNYGTIPKVECYGGKINQVFMNIMNNAIHAMTANADVRPGVLSITTEERGDFVYIKLGDNGPGIPAEIRDKIFDPFFTTKDVGEGTGLGLSIVYNIIESHKGTIKVESEVGKGTTFIIGLPKIQK